jgi:hypothetical protein
VRFRSRLSDFKRLSVKNCNSVDTQVLAAAKNIQNDSVDVQNQRLSIYLARATKPRAGDKIAEGPQGE